MPRGDKSKYTEKQKRQAEHIEEGYEERGVSEREAERRAWATVNKMTGGGKKSGSGRGHAVNNSGRGHAVNKEPARKGGRLGGAAAAARPKSARSASAKKAARTRARQG
jgi:plasmid stabilization system protein ParE